MTISLLTPEIALRVLYARANQDDSLTEASNNFSEDEDGWSKPLILSLDPLNPRPLEPF
jgi:hypothetical protein